MRSVIDVSGGRRAARRSAAARRSGYAVAVVVDLVALVLINVAPGWEVVPFLTDRTNEVLGVVNLSITVNLAVNLLTLFVDGARLRAAGDMVSSAVSFAAALAIWRVFPFSYPEGSVWTAVTRVLLGIGLFGTAVAVLVSAFTLISGRRPDDRSRPAPRSSSTGAVG